MIKDAADYADLEVGDVVKLSARLQFIQPTLQKIWDYFDEIMPEEMIVSRHNEVVLPQGLTPESIRCEISAIIGSSIPFLRRWGYFKKDVDPGFSIPSIEVGSDKVYPIWTYGPKRNYQKHRDETGWIIDQWQRERRKLLGEEKVRGPIIATAAALAVIKQAKTENRVVPRLSSITESLMVTQHNKKPEIYIWMNKFSATLKLRKNVIDAEISGAGEQFKLKGTTLTLSGGSKKYPESMMHGMKGKPLKDVIGINVFENEERIITSVKHQKYDTVFGVSAPKTGTVIEIN